MNLSFSTKVLRRFCESQATAERKFGVVLAARLRRRLADLLAAANVSDLVAGSPEERDVDGTTGLALRLDRRHRLVICPSHGDVPMTKKGRVDWSKVTRVKITEIEGSS